MKKILCSMLICLSLSAAALETPRKSRQDNRIQYVAYDSADVTRVNAANGYITTIIFQDGEVVTNYGSGYSTAWEFSTARNYFFLIFKDKDGTTNLVIVTNKRVYNFDVHLVEKEQNATYKLTFSYPLDEAILKEQEKNKAILDNLLKQNDPNTAKQSKYSNYNYSMNFGASANSRFLGPVEAFDDGRFTYFKFKENIDFPAIYSVNSDGESILNSHVEQGYLVVHGVYKEFRLRAGSDVVGIYNDAFSGGSISSDSGTTVKNLNRDIKE